MAFTETALTEILKIFKGEEKKFAEIWIKLYKGAAGAAGTENAATETNRKKVTWAAPSSKVIKNEAALEWATVSTTETYKEVGFWSAESAGTFYGAFALAAERSVNAGDTFKIAAEKLTITAS